VALFGSKDKDSGSDSDCRLQVITLNYVVEGSADMSGQNFVRFTLLTDVTVRPVDGSAPTPAPSWALGEDTHGVIGYVPLDEQAHEELLGRATKGKDEVPATIYTGPWVVRGTILGFDDDPKVLAQAHWVPVRDAEIRSVAPGSTLEPIHAPLVVLTMYHLQGLVPAVPAG
jgi:hypothetical protein